MSKKKDYSVRDILVGIINVIKLNSNHIGQEQLDKMLKTLNPAPVVKKAKVVKKGKAKK